MLVTRVRLPACAPFLFCAVCLPAKFGSIAGARSWRPVPAWRDDSPGRAQAPAARDLLVLRHGDVAQMVERSLSMREALGSMPSFSIFGKVRLWH